MTTAYPLYNPQMEHESCGVGAVIDLCGQATHRTVSDAADHRRTPGAPRRQRRHGTTGDGRGHTHAPAARSLCPVGGGGGRFPRQGGRLRRGHVLSARRRDRRGEHLPHLRFPGGGGGDARAFLARRALPSRTAGRGGAAQHAPHPPVLPRPGRRDAAPGEAFDRRLYILRRQFEKQQTGAYVCSLSCRTIVYKGMMLVTQLRAFYDDLQDEDYASPLAMVHSPLFHQHIPQLVEGAPAAPAFCTMARSTPSAATSDRMRAREETMRSPLLGEDMLRVLPVVEAGGSDRRCWTTRWNFSTWAACPCRSRHGAFCRSRGRDRRKTTPWRDLYRYYSTMMEPWDGPAAILYSDGDVVCASLDRNGLRPLRCALTDEGRLILSSEAGALFEETRASRAAGG